MGDEKRAAGRGENRRDGEHDGRRGSGGDGLAEELRTLGRSMRVPDVDEESMAERVLARILAEALPVPVPEPPSLAVRLRRLLRRRWRAGAAGLSGLLVVLVLTPPVRAAVTDWFDFGGVEVRYDPSATPSPGAPVPDCPYPVSKAEAGRRAGFAPRFPAELGAPDRIALAGTSKGRMVMSLCWTSSDGRTVRLDEFPAGLDISFAKDVRLMPEWVQLNTGELGGTTGVWFAEPHVLRFRLIGGTGGEWTQSVRTAGPTLLWEEAVPDAAAYDRLTLRLEGVGSIARAKQIAESVP